jgi:hypothetical protein
VEAVVVRFQAQPVLVDQAAEEQVLLEVARQPLAQTTQAAEEEAARPILQAEEMVGLA